MPAFTPYTSGHKLCFYKIGPYTFATEANFVKQITSLTRFSPVPRSSRYLWGLVAVESAILPLINSYEVLGLGAAKPNLAMVLDPDVRPIALALDEVLGFKELEPVESETPLASVLPEGLESLLKGSFSFQNDDFHWLDAPKLLALLEDHLEVV